MFSENRFGPKVCYFPFVEPVGEDPNERKERELRKKYPDLQKAYNKYINAKIESRVEKKALEEYEFLLKLYWDYD